MLDTARLEVEARSGLTIELFFLLATYKLVAHYTLTLDAISYSLLASDVELRSTHLYLRGSTFLILLLSCNLYIGGSCISNSFVLWMFLNF